MPEATVTRQKGMGKKMGGRILFSLLTLLTVSTSGMLTYMGAVNMYRGVPFMHYVLVGLIAVYIFSITFFWSQLYAYTGLSRRSIRHTGLLLAVGAVVLLIIWFTSTYFNIISLSGMLVTHTQIQQKMDRLDFELIGALEDEQKKLRDVQNHLRSLAELAQINADNELELDGRGQESSRGPMFGAYRALGHQLALLSEAMDEHARQMEDILRKDTREAIESFRKSVSSVPYLEVRQDLVSQTASSLRLSYSQHQLKKRLAQTDAGQGKEEGIVVSGSDSGKVPDFIKELGVPALADEAPNQEDQQEAASHRAPSAQQGSAAERFFKELQGQTREFRYFLEVMMETLRLGSPSVMWEVRDRYQELLNRSVRDLMTETTAPDVHVKTITTAINLVEQQLKSAYERLETPSRHFPPIIRERTRQQFIPFLKRTAADLEEVQTAIGNQQEDGVSLAREPEFYRQLRLEPVDVAVWKPEYRSIPMIALAVLIDYILIPILLIKGIVARTRAENAGWDTEESDALPATG